MTTPVDEVTRRREELAARIDAEQKAHAKKWRDVGDAGLALRLIQRHGEDIRYCATWDDWLVWDGRRWARDEKHDVERRVRELPESILLEAAAAHAAGSTDRGKALVKLSDRATTAQAARATLFMARSDEAVRLVARELDRDPWALNVGNGTLDLRTGTLRPHERADLLTKMAPVDYEPEAPCPLWEAFLRRIFDGSEELVSFAQRWAGYALTGDMREQCFWFGFGAGANGKSTFVNALAAVLGDYAKRIPASCLMQREAGAIPRDIALLPGVRLAIASELESGRLNESLVKDITGGDKITAEAKYEMPFEFAPQCKLMLHGNHKPVVRGTDLGIWRRVRLVPFNVTIPQPERDPELPAKLEPEYPGILAWAVRGCLEWQRQGLGTAREVTEATAEYREEQDVLGAFLAECCETGARYDEAFGALYGAYRKWAERSGEHLMSQTAFGRALGERGYANEKDGRGSRRRKGLRLLPASMPDGGDRWP